MSMLDQLLRRPGVGPNGTCRLAFIGATEGVADGKAEKAAGEAVFRGMKQRRA